jgi:hypothetical protein
VYRQATIDANTLQLMRVFHRPEDEHRSIDRLAMIHVVSYHNYGSQQENLAA